jgi:hypothetical protein
VPFDSCAYKQEHVNSCGDVQDPVQSEAGPQAPRHADAEIQAISTVAIEKEVMRKCILLHWVLAEVHLTNREEFFKKISSNKPQTREHK